MPVIEHSATRVPEFHGFVVIDFLYPLLKIRGTTAVIGSSFVISAVLGLYIAILLIVFRVERVTEPISRLAKAANQIAAGQRAIVVEKYSNDEVGRLTQAFNKMSVSLAENEQALQRRIAEASALYEIAQDITAQVDFTSVINAGRRNGLDPVGFTTQAQFLQNLGLSRLQQRLAQLNLPQNAAQANRAGMLELGKTTGLGGFKVLVQGKGVAKPELWGFEPSSEAAGLVENLPVLLLTGLHLSLPRGRYPNSELELPAGWTFDG